MNTTHHTETTMTARLCFDCDHRWISTSAICPACNGTGQDDPRVIDTFSPVRSAMFSGNRPGESLACKAAGGGISIGEPMTVQGFIEWLDVRALTIVRSGVEGREAFVEVAYSNSPIPLDPADPDTPGAWFEATELVDAAGGVARWMGADVIVSTSAGPLVRFKTCTKNARSKEIRRYPARDKSIRPDWMSRAEWVGEFI